MTAVRLSGVNRLVVKSAQVAAKVSLGNDTVTECLRFFGTVGLLDGARGRYSATAAGLSWAEVRSDDHTRGRLMLHGLFKNHWSAQASLAALADGPVKAEALAQHLQQGLSSNIRRSMYLIEWLVEALVLHRDRYGRVHAPTDESFPVASVPSTRSSTSDEGRPILGMDTHKLYHLPTEQFVALMGTYTNMLAIDANVS